jgi:formylmethanofuran dehydrogenase subunit E
MKDRRLSMMDKRLPFILRGIALFGLIALSSGLPVGADAHVGHSDVPERNVIVDTDMGLDDVRAIFALLADSTINIDAFLTVGGSAALGKGTDNLIGLLEASGSSSIRIIKGNEKTGLEPPPWRHTANNVGGAPFPPPRRATAELFSPTDLAGFMEQIGEIEYLALGPLSNLDMLETGMGGSLDLIHTIWIPAVIEERRISDWNLLYDAGASQTVFAKAAEVVLIDISRAGKIDGPGFLSTLEGESYPVLWIQRLLRRMGEKSGHVMIYDDLAVAAFTRQVLLEFDDQTYVVKKGGVKYLELVISPGGNVRVARLRDHTAAMAALEELWVRGPIDRRMHAHTHEVPIEVLLKTFHGHLGPYVVIGYRMGKLSVAELESEGPFGISAEVHSPLETPRSCLIDGVQLGSGCTMGKGNITVQEAPEPAWAVFASGEDGQVTIRLRPEIPALVQELLNSKGVEATGRAFFQIRLDSLFTIERRRP